VVLVNLQNRFLFELDQHHPGRKERGHQWMGGHPSSAEEGILLAFKCFTD
jgi:hypothetical protein